jgi:[acyl-carrier-protein] S-malonyltransferase
MVAGHSVGEYAALVTAGAMTFENGLRLVSKRAIAMQKACDKVPSTMAAIIGLDDSVIEDVCEGITDELVVPANYNCPGQLVISGTVPGVNKACEILTEKGAKRALVIKVAGAFHSPLMEPARDELARAINETTFKKPVCPIYQNVDGKPHTNPEIIKSKLIEQLIDPVMWTQTMMHMLKDGATSFTEIGPGKVLQGLIKKVDRQVEATSISSFVTV